MKERPSKGGKAGLVVALSGLLLVGGIMRPVWSNTAVSGLQVGNDAPHFVAKDLSGNNVDLMVLVRKNKAVVVNFWGLRCGPCIQEMPHLDAIYKRHRTAGVEVIGVNVDGVDANIIKAQLLRIQEMPSYTLVTDEELKVADLYNLTAAPFTVLVDSSGKIVYIHEGYEVGDEKELGARIDQLLH
jgi:peroxiredoxin